MALPPIASFLVRTRTKDPGAAANFGLALSMGTRPLSSSTRELMKTKTGFEIFEISHIFAELDWRLRSNEPDVLNCEVDASCSGDTQKNAVGRILYNDNGTFVCTGTLLNNVAQDQIPYFLTANHCVSTQAVAQTVEVFWFYQTTSCNSGVLRNWVHSPPGANLLATQPSNDFALLRLQNNAPAGAVFSAWTTAVQSTGTSVFGLHHPDGYVPPAIPSYLRRASGSITSTNGNCLGNGYRIDWTSGVTEHGIEWVRPLELQWPACGRPKLRVYRPRAIIRSTITASSPTSIPKYNST